MPRLITIFVILVGLGWLGYSLFKPVQIATVNGKPAAAVMTPEEEFTAMLASDAVDAERLGFLSETFPRVANAYLKDRSFRLTGVVQDIYVSGLGGRRAVVILYRGKQRPLNVVYDLDRYVVTGLRGAAQETQYRLIGKELFQIKNGAREPKPFFIRGSAFNKVVTFDRIVPSGTMFTANAE